MKYKVTMICKEIWRGEKIIDTHDNNYSHEAIKDMAWADFDTIAGQGLEQENYTKIEELKQ